MLVLIVVVLVFDVSMFAQISDLLTLQATEPAFNVFYDAFNATLSYPSIYNGYLWTTTSRTDNALRKYDLATERLLQSAPLLPLKSSTAEAFSAFVYKGLVYVPMIGYQTSNTILAIYDEATLAEVFRLDKKISEINAFTNVIYDSRHDRLLFGCGFSSNNRIGIFAVDPAQSKVASAYYFISLGTEAGYAGWEVTPVVFNNKVYAIEINNGAGNNGIVTTRILSSSDLNTWTLEYSTQGYNHGPGAYFAHISANANYIVAGVISNANDGITTYRYMYKSTTGAWREYNTGELETFAEDHPNVNAIDDNSTFFLEVSQRQGSQDAANAKCYLFDASTATAKLLFIVPDYGFNDRAIAIDTANNNIYLQNGENWSTYSSQILKVHFNFQLADH